MRLCALKILSMPGFESQGLTPTQIGPALNIVIGPNASGKTTLCRAIQALLWEECLRSVPAARILSDWESEGRRFGIEADGHSLKYSADNGSANPPPLPPAYLAHSYVITIDDLFEAGSGTEERLAQTIAREMTGGFDLAALRRDFAPPKNAANFKGELSKAQAAVLQIKREQSALRRDEANLPQLNAELREASRARRRLDLIEAAIAILEIQRNLAAKQAESASFAPGVAAILGNELETLKDLRNALDRSLSQIDSEKANLDRLNSEVTALRFRGEAKHPALAQVILEDLRRKTEKIEHLQEKITGHRGILQETAAKLAGIGAPEKLPPVNLEMLDLVEHLQRRLEENSQQLSRIKTEMKCCSDEAPAAEPKDLSQAVDVLRRWLRAGTQAAPALPGFLWFAAFVAALLVIFGALLLSYQQSPFWSAAALPAAVLLWAILSYSWRRKDNARSMLEAEYQFGEQPPVWDEDHVLYLLEQLENGLLSAKSALLSRDRLKRLQADLDSALADRQKLEGERRELAARIGIAPPGISMGLSLLASDIARYQNASLQLAALERALLESERGFSATLEELNCILQRCGQETAASTAEAIAAVGRLQDAASEFSRLKQEIGYAEATLKRQQEEARVQQKRLAELFSRLGLVQGDEAGLHGLCAAMPAFRSCRDELRILEMQQQTARENLARNDPALLEIDEADLTRQKEELTALAGRRDALQNEILRIEDRVNEAERGRKLEAALEQQQRAHERLQVVREQAVSATAAQLLIDQVEEEYQLQNEPLVFKEAGRLFELFTNGAFRLLSAPPRAEQPQFRAFDTARGKALGLTQLSRGTHIQLQLAVRFAFAAAAESGVKLPLLLDEALCASDPHRFKAISEVLIGMAKEGRQVFYLSSQPLDAEALMQAARRGGLADPVLIQLSKGETTELSLSASAHGARDLLPDPKGRSLEEYVSALKPAAISLREGSAAVHIAHLVDDPDLIHSLLSSGISTFGQLKTLVIRGAFSAFVDERRYRKIRARAEVVDAFYEAWKIGRGLPLTKSILEEAGLQGRILQEVSDRARQANWDAKLLLSEIDPDRNKVIKRFYASTYKRLVSELIERGHFDPVDCLDRDTALLQVLSSMNAPIQEGHIEREEVRGIFETLWNEAERNQTVRQQ